MGEHKVKRRDGVWIAPAEWLVWICGKIDRDETNNLGDEELEDWSRERTVQRLRSAAGENKDKPVAEKTVERLCKLTGIDSPIRRNGPPQWTVDGRPVYPKNVEQEPDSGSVHAAMFRGK